MILILTIPKFPYASFRESALAANSRLQVKVTGVQWSWQIDPHTIRTGTTVEFLVTSKDVNHGFAIFNPEGHIVGQVQAMPGYPNTLVMRFNEEGTYQIRCLELCGLFHASMLSTIQVTR